MTQFKAKSVAAALLTMVGTASLVSAATTKDTLLVEVDQAKILRLEEPAHTVVIGNPAIADALVQSREMLIVTGKSYGVTNLIVLNADGATVEDLLLHVRGDESGIVTVQRGSARLSYSCAPSCERTLAVGDTADSYEVLNTQIEDRLGLAEGQANPR